MAIIPRTANAPQDDSDEQSPTEMAADVIYWLLYRGDRVILDNPASDLSRFAPHHEDLKVIGLGDDGKLDRSG